MALSLDVLTNYIDESTAALTRAERIRAEGQQENADAIASEWEGASASRAFFFSVDSACEMQSFFTFLS